MTDFYKAQAQHLDRVFDLARGKETMSEPNLKDELRTEYDNEMVNVSSCCGADFNEVYQEEMLMCSDCHDHCSSEPALTFEEWVNEDRSEPQCIIDQKLEDYREYRDSEVSALNNK